MSEKRFTLREFAEAIRKNGLPQQTGGFFFYEDEFGDMRDSNFPSTLIRDEATIVGACAFGQALINLGIERPYLGNTIMGDIYEKIWKLNDIDHYSLKQIADWIEKNYADSLDTLSFTVDEFDYSPYLGEASVRA